MLVLQLLQPPQPGCLTADLGAVAAATVPTPLDAPVATDAAAEAAVGATDGPAPTSAATAKGLAHAA